LEINTAPGNRRFAFDKMKTLLEIIDTTNEENIIEKIMNDQTYKGYNIYFAPHPKLFGNYEIFKEENFVSRAKNLKEAKQKINSILKTK